MARSGKDIATLGFQETSNILAAEHRNLSPKQIENVLQRNLGETSIEQMEDFLSVMKDIGNGVVQALPAVLPVVGSAFGPVGTVVGTAAGALVGGATQAAKKGSTKPAKSKPKSKSVAKAPAIKKSAPVAPANTLVTANNNAAAQLFSLIMRPEVLQSVMAMMLGSDGAKEIKVADQDVPVGAFANLLAVMANNTAAEYNSIAQTNDESVPDYLMDCDGQFRCDIAVPEQRAALLLELLQETMPSPSRTGLHIMPNYSAYDWNDWELMDEQEYDALDLADIYSYDEI